MDAGYEKLLKSANIRQSYLRNKRVTFFDHRVYIVKCHALEEWMNVTMISCSTDSQDEYYAPQLTNTTAQHIERLH